MPPEEEKTSGLKVSMFNLSNSHFVLTTLHILMLAVGVGTVRGSIWVKYSNIEKSTLKPTTLEARSLDI